MNRNLEPKQKAEDCKESGCDSERLSIPEGEMKNQTSMSNEEFRDRIKAICGPAAA